MLPLLLLLCILIMPAISDAETKVITAEATYIMGDGESPSFAEAMVLQKAKQMALEQAGTYVESYTKTKNYDLTHEEIQTIAGGVLQVEVLEKTRTLVGEGLRFYLKIKATVTTDKMEELAQRIKGKNVAEEYKKLQEDYARLSKEIETWKQLVAKTSSGPEREAALDQIREREKAFATIQKSEVALFRRLVSGEALASKALTQMTEQREKILAQKAEQHKKEARLDALFWKIKEQGMVISLGEPDVHADISDPLEAEVTVPVVLNASNEIKKEIKEVSRSLGGEELEAVMRVGFKPGLLRASAIRVWDDKDVVSKFHERIADLTFVLEFVLDDGGAFYCTAENSRKRNPIAAIAYFERFGYEGPTIFGLGYSSNSGGFLLGYNEFFIAVFDEPTSFSVTAELKLQDVKRIKSVRAKFLEARAEAISTNALQATNCKFEPTEEQVN